MAGGSFAAIVHCFHCQGKAIRDYDGSETDYYTCERCQSRFGIDWSHGGLPSKPCWSEEDEIEYQKTRYTQTFQS